MQRERSHKLPFCPRGLALKLPLLLFPGGSGFHFAHYMTPSLRLPFIGNFAIALAAQILANSVPVLAAEDLEVPLPPAFPLSRYSLIWDSKMFVRPKPAPQEPVPAPPEPVMAPFPYTLVGISTLKGNFLVYLADADGRVIELAPGKPSEGLVLDRIEPGSVGGPPASCQIRHGPRLITLKFPDQPITVKSVEKTPAQNKPAGRSPDNSRSRALDGRVGGN